MMMHSPDNLVDGERCEGGLSVASAPRFAMVGAGPTAAPWEDSLPAMDTPAPTPPPADTYQFLRSIVPPEPINQRQPSAPQSVYTAFVTVWLRLCPPLHRR